MTTILDLPIELLCEIRSLLPLTCTGISSTCKALKEVFDDTHYWSQIIKKLGLQLSEDSPKKTVEKFYRHFNDQMTEAGFQSTANTVYSQYQAHLLTLKEKPSQNKGLEYFHAQVAPDFNIFLHIFRLFPINSTQRGEATIKAAKNNRLKTVELLSHLGPINPEDRGEAVTKAAKNGCLPMVQALILSGPVNQADYSEAALAAAKLGRLDIIVELRKLGPFGQEQLPWAIEEATDRNYTEIVDLLKKDQ